MAEHHNQFNHAENQLIQQELFHFLTPGERELLLRNAQKIVLKKKPSFNSGG